MTWAAVVDQLAGIDTGYVSNIFLRCHPVHYGKRGLEKEDFDDSLV